MAFHLARSGSNSSRASRTPDEERKASRSASTVLVVDDEPQVRAMISATLEQHGFQIRQAASGREALAQLAAEPHDLVLTDLVMQDGNGIALLDRARIDYPQLPVVVVTAVHDIHVAIDAMRRGAYDFLLKPFEREGLLRSVHSALAHRRELQDSYTYRESLEQAVRARTDLLRQAMEDLEHSYDITLEALGDALDLKDSETEGHSKRVTAYTIALARAIGVSSQEMKSIARGAFLHDLGKMAIPDEILRKPSSLTPEEQSIMREHCTRGYTILRKIPFLAEAAEIVLSHQEHHDGKGYPNGLRGYETPIGSRIFAVADALDAITSNRPYRKSRTFEEARAEISRCAGTQFDPAVVDVFLSIPTDLWKDLRTEITNENKRFSSLICASPPPYRPH